MLRRIAPNIAFRTEGYPEKVARRLRAVNIAAWCAGASMGVFAAIRITDPNHWQYGLATLAIAAAVAATPLLHRFGPLAAPIALSILFYGHVVRVVSTVGTHDGVYLGLLTASGLVVLLVGIEHVRVAAGAAAVAAILMVVLRIAVPYDTGNMASRLPSIASYAANVAVNAAIMFVIVYYAVRQTARAEATAEREYERSESLLRNILPPKVAERLKEPPGHVIADRYEQASVLFADMAGFTARGADTEPEELVQFLNRVFSQLDALVEQHGLEKIKTTGDAYMVVSGVPEPRADHAEAIARLALDVRDALGGLIDPKGRAVPVRIGIASGPVVAGVVGTRKFFYDVWGDTVNTAARMEQTGEPGRIQVPAATQERLMENFVLEERGVIDVRGKGQMQTWFLLESKDGNRQGSP